MSLVAEEPSPIRRIGGMVGLRDIIDDFVRRVVEDPMIGFMFRSIDPLTLSQREFEFTARFLGADIQYSGRPLREAHARHRILGGQFDRRRKILHDVLLDHRVPPDLRARWLEHVDTLRSVVTQQGAGECSD